MAEFFGMSLFFGTTISVIGYEIGLKLKKNILYLFNECSPQTPLSGWKSTLSRYLQSNGKTDHQDEMDYEMTANKFFIY